MKRTCEQAAQFRSVILAGERPGGSALSRAFNISASVMVPVAGKPALARVIQALKDSREVSGGIVCGPAAGIVETTPELKSILQDSDHEWLEPDMGPAASALSALAKLNHYPALLTAGDHALLTGEIVDDFCNQALSCSAASASNGKSNYDLVIGFVPFNLVHAAWPQSRRTVLKFSDGGYCGSNLFAVLNPEGRKALAFWRQVEADRKHPWRIARRFGLPALLRYLFRRLTLEDALRSLSKASGCRIGHVQVNFARAAVDVDSIEDQQLAEMIISDIQATPLGKPGGSAPKTGFVERVNGLKRLPKEHFSIYVGKQGQNTYLPVASNSWSYFADPFIWQHQGQLWLLVEEFEYLKNRGRLRCIPLDGSLRPGVAEPMMAFDYHASFPFLFEHGGKLFMLPETSRGNCVDLFVCENFPGKWRHVTRLLDGIDAADTVLFQHDGLFWMITSVRKNRQNASRWLAVYFCEDLLSGNWQPHPVNGSRKFYGTRYSTGRNGGAVTYLGGNLLRLAQHNQDYYGQSIRVMQIDRLTPSDYIETPYSGSNILTEISRSFSPHHISLYGDFIAFDVRDRMSYLQYIPFLRKPFRRPKHSLIS